MKPNARRSLPTAPASSIDSRRHAVLPQVPSPAAPAERGKEESEYGRLRHDLGLFFRRLEKAYEEAG
jgi:hypothetical protein